MIFSIVVTCHNYERYVCEAVDSVLAQQGAEFEVLVVEDGSTDRSLELLRQRYAQHPSVRILAQSNRGQLAAFAAGCAAARGDVVCFLDADDRYEPGYLAALEQVYAAQPAPELVLANLRRFGAQEGIWHPAQRDADLGFGTLPAWILHQFHSVPTSAVSMRRGFAQRVTQVPESFHAQWRVRADDCLLLGANVLGARSATLAAAHVLYRIHDSNNWARKPRSYADEALYASRLASFVEHHAAAAGLSPRHLQYASLEFKTRERPSWKDLSTYLWLQLQASRSWARTLRPIAAILKHFLRAR